MIQNLKFAQTLENYLVFISSSKLRKPYELHKTQPKLLGRYLLINIQNKLLKHFSCKLSFFYRNREENIWMPHMLGNTI